LSVVDDDPSTVPTVYLRLLKTVEPPLIKDGISCLRIVPGALIEVVIIAILSPV